MKQRGFLEGGMRRIYRQMGEMEKERGEQGRGRKRDVGKRVVLSMDDVRHFLTAIKTRLKVEPADVAGLFAPCTLEILLGDLQASLTSPRAEPCAELPGQQS